MVLDFSKISIYELLALVLSTIAILIPIISKLWNKWVVKPKLIFIPNSKINIYFNMSGAYLRVDGAYEAINKSITIRNGKVNIVREDNNTLKLEWSTFISPVWQNFSGNYASTNEYSHPFKIGANSLICAFIEYSNQMNDVTVILEKVNKVLEPLASQIKENNDSFLSALKIFSEKSEYISALNQLESAFFWRVGSYCLIIENQFGTKKQSFEYKFDIQPNEREKLHQNIETMLQMILAEKYNYPLSFNSITIDIKDKTNT